MADHEPRPTRRILFHGLGALGVAVALAGCGSDNTGSTEPAPDQSKSTDGGSGGGPASGQDTGDDQRGAGRRRRDPGRRRRS